MLVVCAPAVVLLLLLCGRALGLTVLAGFLLAYALHLAGSPEGCVQCCACVVARVLRGLLKAPREVL